MDTHPQFKGAESSLDAPEVSKIKKAVETLSIELKDEAERIEKNRFIPEDILGKVKSTGIFRLVKPRLFGGLESNPTVMIDVLSQLAVGCASTAWVSAGCGLHPWMLGTFPLAAQEDVWLDDFDTFITGTYAPTNHAQKVHDGILISGSWHFASGCQNAEWAILGLTLPGDKTASKNRPAFAILPMSDIDIEDIWFAMGLAGTGSNSLHLKNVFVPDHRIMSFEDMSSGRSPGAKAHNSFVYNIPFLSVVPYSIISVALGAAKGALDAFVDETANRKTRGGTADAGHKVGGFPIVQSRVEEAAANIETGFGILRHDLENNYAAAKSGAGLSITRRIENRRNQAMAMRLAVQAVNALFCCVGGSGLLLNQPVQRAWRDVNAAARHAGLNWDVQSTLSGRHALGYDTPGGY